MLLSALAALSWVGAAFADSPPQPLVETFEKAAHLEDRPTAPAKGKKLGRIEGLEFPARDFDVEIRQEGDQRQVKLFVPGTFTRASWSLVFGTGEGTLSPDGKFLVTVPVPTDKPLKIEFNAVSDFGEVQRERLQITFKDPEILKKTLVPPVKRWSLTPELALTYVAYQQTSVAPIGECLLTAKASGRFWIQRERWELAASGYLSLLPLLSTTSNPIRFLGLNFLAGYWLPFVKRPWAVGIRAGGYYTTTLVLNSPAYGFINTMGPQLSPTVRRAFESGKAASAYFKFSPITNGLMPLSLPSNEIAVGGTFEMLGEDRRRWIFALNLSWLNLIFGGGDAQVMSLSAGVAYAF